MFLEDLVDTAPEADCVTQTDEFLDRPPTPAFVPAKSGVDSTTQIEKGEAGVQLQRQGARDMHTYKKLREKSANGRPSV